ncbi:MAG: hypothetical protein IPP99_14285 [Chitinophagaceae bacterium]|nr:hypothetical protein [Chitinophagaceae bacterium]
MSIFKKLIPDTTKIALRQVKAIVWVSLTFSLIYVFIYQGGFLNPEKYSKSIKGLVEILNQIFISYITGLFLLFLFDTLPKTKKRISIATSIGNNVLQINRRIEYLMNEIAKKAPVLPQKFIVDEKLFFSAIDKIDLELDLVKVWFYPDLSFREFTVRTCNDVISAVNNINLHADLLNEKWISNLVRISDSTNKVLESLEFRFAKPKIEGYFLWGLYADTKRLMEDLMKDFNKQYHSHSMKPSPRYHPKGLTFEADRKISPCKNRDRSKLMLLITKCKNRTEQIS